VILFSTLGGLAKAKEQRARTAAAETTLGARADLAEHYAAAAMEIAAAAVDEAERAAVEAVVARMDANGVQAPTASKSA